MSPSSKSFPPMSPFPARRSAVGRRLVFAIALLLPAAASAHPGPARPDTAVFTSGSASGVEPVSPTEFEARTVLRPVNGLGPDTGTGCLTLWSRPVDAPINDGYRPPSNPYGPGNRGLEFGTESGDPVRAVADGTVRFAGPVGGNQFVTLQHPSGLRSTYGFVEQVLVTKGEAVRRGHTIAVAGPGFHLTARVAGRYRDPTPLLEVTCYRVRLVPIPDGFSTD